MTLLKTESSGDAGFGEDAFETKAVFIRGSDPLEPLDGVVGDEIHLRPNGGGALGEDGGVLGVGIDAIDEDVFEGDLLVLSLIHI